jgi:hypothetical protein
MVSLPGIVPPKTHGTTPGCFLFGVTLEGVWKQQLPVGRGPLARKGGASWQQPKELSFWGFPCPAHPSVLGR